MSMLATRTQMLTEKPCVAWVNDMIAILGDFTNILQNSNILFSYHSLVALVKVCVSPGLPDGIFSNKNPK
jgi:hypothetical protein